MRLQDSSKQSGSSVIKAVFNLGCFTALIEMRLKSVYFELRAVSIRL